ncbi:hypothetical protein HDU90_001673 [Geranomyces variabilis]|nr:hypothetical protein HDU90_001673 [Geranomyces variabilis]
MDNEQDQQQAQELMPLEKIRLGCVPEHFSSPLYQAVEKRLFTEAGIEVEIVSCPGGTGEMVTALNEGQIDVAIALTEGLIASLSNTADASFRIIGTYTSSPLTWSIATSPTGKHAGTPRESPGPEAWQELKNAKIGISRFGSGSHIIPFVLADKMGWLEKGKEPFTFVPLKNIDGLIHGVKSGEADAFLWERVMTKPHYDSGELHHLSNITPPWPAFMIAASNKALVDKQALKTLLAVITKEAAAFMQGRDSGKSVHYVTKRFKLPIDDVKSWFAPLGFPTDARNVSSAAVAECISTLKKAGVIVDQQAEIPMGKLMDEDIAQLE